MLAALPLLAAGEAAFLPADPPRRGQVAFWTRDGEPPDVGVPPSQLTLPDGAALRQETALLLPVEQALPLLTRCRALGATGRASATTAFWGAAATLALTLLARGRVQPATTPAGAAAWQVGPLDPADHDRLSALAATMPPELRAAALRAGAGGLAGPGGSQWDPVAAASSPALPAAAPPGACGVVWPGGSPGDPVAGGSVPAVSSPGPGAAPEVPAAEPLVLAFLDAVADALTRTPAARQPAPAPPPSRNVISPRLPAREAAAVPEPALRVSLRLEFAAAGQPDAEEYAFRAVVQLGSLADPAVLTDAADLWAGRAAAPELFGTQARSEVARVLRRAARVWPPAAELLAAAAPAELELSGAEAAALLGGAGTRLSAAGVAVHVPKDLVRGLTATGVLEPAGEGPRSAAETFLSSGALLDFRWRVALGDQELTAAELDRLVGTHRPIVRLRDRWVLVDGELARRLRRRTPPLTALDALGAALTGVVELDGERVPVAAGGVLAELRARIARPESGAGPQAAPEALAGTLRDYQLRGLDWLHRMTSLGLGGCLADDMGLGKTVTLIALHLRRQEQQATAGPTLVVCPASLLGNWEREIGRFAPATPVCRFHGPGRDLTGTPADGFVLTTYGTMRRDAERLAAAHPWGLLVADEAQHAKNPHARTARALRAIPSRGRVALTGTPVENNLTELWALLDWTTPGLLGTLPAFRDRYARAVEGDRDERAAAQLAYLVRPFLLRRRKSDPGIAPELPPKTETDRPVSLTREQVSLYEALVRELMAEIEESAGIARRGLVMKLLTGLKQVCNHPAQFLKEPATARLPGRSGKLQLLDQLLDTVVAEDGSALVFTQYVSMGRLIERHLADRGIPALFLHGGTPVRRREQMVDAFQDGGPRVFLLSLKAAGTGLNLTRADHVIHYDRWWNPAVEDQATDRAYRIGQTRPVQVHRLIAEGTVEDRVAGMLRRKRELADAVLGSGEAAFGDLTDGELAELVTLRRPRR
ncbi:DEAD/DEAH box helicase [Streptomyces sp. NBC_01198]|nr:DEAD/DEAH box helicase [Streptomyces sp. NBC_01198]